MSARDQRRADVRAGAWPLLRTCGELRRGRDGALGCLLVALAPPSAAAVSIGGPFELVDQHGVTRTAEDFRDRYMLIYFGFTHCPDSCPTALLKITHALEGLAEHDVAKAERVVPIFVSVDPERDTPAVLRSYAAHFHPRLVALTGTQKELERLGRAYGVFFAKVPTGPPGEYLIDHTGFVYLIGPDGRYVEHFESDASADDLVAALQRHVFAAEVGGS